MIRLITLIGFLLLAGSAWAQEDDVTSASVNLAGVLANLKQSVDKLKFNNDQLVARDKYIEDMVQQLQMQLGKLQEEGSALNAQVSQLSGNNARRAEAIAQLEKQNYDLDNGLQKNEAGIKMITQSLDAGYLENQRLLLQLKGVGNVPAAVAVVPLESPQELQVKKEKLKLMKMIADSQANQASLHEQILQFQQNIPLKPGAEALARQQMLKEQIQDLQGQINALPSQSPQGYSHAELSDEQVNMLEAELKTLQSNYDQLKDLMGKMANRVKTDRMAVNHRVEDQQLQSNIEDLDHQSKSLMALLDDLRSQMVDLDKRKSRLEAMLQEPS